MRSGRLGKYSERNHLAAKPTHTPRQREIMDMVVAGQPRKNIAADLNISQRTVENHRAAIMERTGCKSILALARLTLAASGTNSVIVSSE